MSFFKKLFGGSSPEEGEHKEQKSPFMAEEKDNTPIDELFTKNFLRNGGKFLYCTDSNEVKTQFENILEENDWFEKDVMCTDSTLYGLLDENKLSYQDIKKPSFLFTSCEALLADEGSVFFSSKQIKEYKVDELPNNIVVLAKTSQIVPNKNEGLRRINNKYKTGFPSNITSFKHFKKATDDSFMSYGCTPKNLYLILLENL